MKNTIRRFISALMLLIAIAVFTPALFAADPPPTGGYDYWVPCSHKTTRYNYIVERYNTVGGLLAKYFSNENSCGVWGKPEEHIIFTLDRTWSGNPSSSSVVNRHNIAHFFGMPDNDNSVCEQHDVYYGVWSDNAFYVTRAERTSKTFAENWTSDYWTYPAGTGANTVGFSYNYSEVKSTCKYNSQGALGYWLVGTDGVPYYNSTYISKQYISDIRQQSFIWEMDERNGPFINDGWPYYVYIATAGSTVIEWFQVDPPQMDLEHYWFEVPAKPTTVGQTASIGGILSVIGRDLN